jgi:hypothetical protein
MIEEMPLAFNLWLEKGTSIESSVPDPDPNPGPAPLVRGMDTDPSIIKQN